MRATLMYGAGDVRVETVPDPVIEQPTDAIVRTVVACICGSDLHPYHSMPAADHGTPMGHEFIGVVEDIGPKVTQLRVGGLVIAPFAWSDGTCPFCRAGLHTSCARGGFFSGTQAELVRVPHASGTLVSIPADVDPALLPSLLTLSDVYGTGFYAAVRGNISRGDTVVVIGDGAVGLLAVLSARQLGADRIILMGRHTDRTALGRDYGATDVVADRGDDGIAAVRELTDGQGAPVVLEAVGLLPAYEQAIGVVRPAAPSAGLVSPSTSRPRSGSVRCSGPTSRSLVVPPRSAPTSTGSCRPSSTAPWTPVGCSTAPSPSSRRPTGTRPWISGRR